MVIISTGDIRHRIGRARVRQGRYFTDVERKQTTTFGANPDIDEGKVDNMED